MKFSITSVAMGRRSRRRIGKSRIEVVDTQRSDAMKSLSRVLTPSPYDVECLYERFWNEDNPSPEIVKVIDVREVEEA